MKKLISFLLVFMLLLEVTVIPTSAEEEYAIKSIVSAESRTFFITNDGKVMASGSNKNGIMGLGSSALYTDTVVRVPYLSSIKSVAAGPDEAYFILNNGEVYGTGIGVTNSTTPVKVSDISDVKKIAVNGNSVIFLKNTGELYVYGDNSYGQLGAGSISSVSKITKLSGVSGVKDVQMGDRFTVVLFEDGTVKVTGYDANGRLGLGNTSPIIITTLRSLANNTQVISKIAVGKTHVLYVNNTGGLYGTADSGVSLGMSNTNRVNTISRLTSFVSPIKKIDADEGSFVLLEDGSVWTCGYNSYGADFSKTTSDNTTNFKKVSLDVMDISAGGNHTFLMMENADILTAGKNVNGELGIGKTGTSVVNPTIVKQVYNTYGSRVVRTTNSVIQNGILNPIYAVLVNQDISLDGSSKIQGDVASNNGNVDADWSTKITGDVYLAEAGFYNSPDKSSLGGSALLLNPTYTFDMPTFIEPPMNLINRGTLEIGNKDDNTTISQDGYYDAITLNSGGELIINIGSGKRYIHTRELDLNQGFVTIKGTGDLYLFVDEPFSMKGSSTFNASNSSRKVNVIVRNAGTVDLGGSAIFKGNIFAKYANLSISGSASLVGNAVLGGNSVSMVGSTPLNGLLYAPTANISLKGSSLIRGAIIADSYSGVGSTQVIFTPSSLKLPIESIVNPADPAEPIDEPIVIPEESKEGIKLPSEITEQLKEFDYDLIINVAKDGDKKLGAALGAYKDMLAYVDDSNNNKSLERVSGLVDIFGENFTYHFQYGTYNFSEE